jgi:ethanolamine utilization protein EutN
VQLGLVIGHATATIKHEALEGWRLLVIQPLNTSRKPEADCVIAASGINAAVGQTVVYNSDGKAARDLIGHAKSPVRYFVIAIESEKESD